MNGTPEKSVPTTLQPPKKPRRVHRPASGPKIERAVAEMRAVGLSQKTIAAKLDISQQTVSEVLKREHVQVDIEALNQDIRSSQSVGGAGVFETGGDAKKRGRSFAILKSTQKPPSLVQPALDELWRERL